MRVHKAAGGALVRAQRMEQTISPTLHGRTRTNTSSCANVCASAKLLQRQEWLGNVCNIRKWFAYICMCVRPLYQWKVCMPQTALVQRIFRRRVVVGPGRILRVARSLNPPDLLTPFLSLSFSSPSLPPPLPVGVEGESFSFAPPSQGTTLQLEWDPPCSRLSWFPSQARGKILFQTRTRDELGGEAPRLPGKSPRK